MNCISVHTVLLPASGSDILTTARILCLDNGRITIFIVDAINVLLCSVFFLSIVFSALLPAKHMELETEQHMLSFNCHQTIPSLTVVRCLS